MDGRRDSTHVEVELTEGDRRRGRRRWRRRGEHTDDVSPGPPLGAEQFAPRPGDPPAPGAVAGTPGTGAAPGDVGAGSASLAERVVGSERTRLVSTAIGVGLLALLVGWIAGRAGGGDRDVAESDADTAEPAPATTVLPGEAMPEVDIGPPTATRPRRATTTTTPPRITVEQVSVTELLDDAGFVVAGLSRSGEIVRLDVAGGRAIAQPTGRGFLDGAIATFGADWALVTDPSTGRPMSFSLDEELGPVDIGDPWNPLRVPGTDRFWRGVGDGPFGWERYELTDLHGDRVGPVIDGFERWPAGVDPEGGLIAVVQGSTYSVDVDGVALIGRGEAVAVGAGVVVLRVCDDQLQCGLEVVDRATGDARPLEVGAEEFEFPLGDARGWYGFGLGVVSPDDSAFVLTDPPLAGPPRHVLVEIVTGEVVDLGRVDQWNGPSSTVAFSPDGRFVLHLASATPTVYDRRTGTSALLAEELGPWSQLAVVPRPASDVVPEAPAATAPVTVDAVPTSSP